MAQGQARKVKKKKKSVLKRAAQSRERAEVNQANRTRVRGAMKRLRTAITAGDVTAAGNLLHPTMSAIDQAITKGVLHENTANRYKSRLLWRSTRSKPRPRSNLKIRKIREAGGFQVARLFCFLLTIDRPNEPAEELWLTPFQ